MNDSIETGRQRIKRYEEECKQMLNDLFEDNADRKSCIEMMGYYQSLNDAFIRKLADSKYSDTEIKDCFWGMFALLRTRISGRIQDLHDSIGDDEPCVDNMSLDEIIEVLISQNEQLEVLKRICVAGQLQAGYWQLYRDVLDMDKMCERLREKMKDPAVTEQLFSEAFSEERFEDSDYDYELGCTKEQARKLEKLMRLEFPEFDVLLGRREKEPVTEDKGQSMPQADYETIEVKFNVIE